jgi:uncharacterized protein
MRIWVDLTNSPHVLVLRPLIERMRAAGHEVEITARDFAQTFQLLERYRMDHTRIGHHQGEKVLDKGLGLVQRSLALARWGRGRGFDVAIGHGSNDVTVAAKMLGIPSATAFDYEWARQQHWVNCHLARVVMVPQVIPPERLYPYGATDDKLRRYEGLKEEYYLADFEPDRAVLGELGLDDAEPIVVVRTPPEVSLYHRFENDVFARLLDRLRGIQTVVLPRTPAQREELAAAGGFVVPERAIDGPSLVAFADLVVSAGGTMNREAVALGTPVYTTFEGKLGAVDERLLAEGRLQRLDDPSAVKVVKRSGPAAERVRRDPQILVDLLLST